MKEKITHSSQEDIVSIRDASRILGVNEATLRQWTDEGKLKAFVTPGGHRRYFKSELSKFTRSSQRALGIKDLAVEVEDTSRQHQQIARHFMDSHPELKQGDVGEQKHMAEMGRRILELIVKYISEPAKRTDTISSARKVGAGFGITLAEMGLPLTDSVQEFLSHRDPIIRAAVHLIGKRKLVKSSIVEAIPLANRFIDETLVSMIAAHQQYRTVKSEDAPR